MTRHNKLKRYYLVFEKIQGRSHPTFAELREYLGSHDIEVSQRTIQRDIKDIREAFGIEIVYDHTTNRYSIDEKTSINLESVCRFLEIAATADFIVDSFRDSREVLGTIEFEAGGMLRGIQYLRPLLDAIRRRRYVEFTHVNFHTGRTHPFKVAPLFLKEYQHRFYLIGRQKDVEDEWAFALDRILELAVTKVPCPPMTGTERKIFANIVGVSRPEGPIEEVILSVDPAQAKYLKSLPWHRSQSIIDENPREVRFRLRVIPNYELVQKILALGESITVIKPASLAREVKETLAAALKGYR